MYIGWDGYNWVLGVPTSSASDSSLLPDTLLAWTRFFSRNSINFFRKWKEFLIADDDALTEK